ncbi:amidohydrolase family protein [Streptomyces yunnanensis]|uniref:Amidohydrolase family protein n=1 Tax=Streptomyces yunnanensis TaxID=156453 RepID=A0ABY8APX0_9ACTN|nr:amidohydrolase family protein [Streptomyces yunnanensis]WEB45617.1 amidohydrolase family protein [Streptomyces yunnanensis]
MAADAPGPAAPDSAVLDGLPPLVDHHCHGVVRYAPDPGTFAGFLTEADRPPAAGTSYFDTQTGFAVRRWCPPLLDLPAHCPPERYLARRGELGPDATARRLLSATGIGVYLVDTGLPGDLTGPAETAEAGGGTGREVVRLEALADRTAAGYRGDGTADAAEEFADALARAVRAAADTAVAFKSVAAYRHGLALDPRPPGPDAVRTAARDWLAAGAPRLADPVLLRHLIWLAVATGRPLQLHTGFGDPDLRLDHADPTLLTDLVRATADTGTDLVLLHCYPYHRQAAYLAGVFPHVHADVGLTLTHVGPRAPAVLAEFLELAPFGKLLFSTDAYGLPELYVVGSALFRTALAEVLGAWTASGAWSAADARRVAGMLAAGNARRVYGLDGGDGEEAGR